MLTNDQKREFNALMKEYRRLKNGGGGSSMDRNAIRVERSRLRRLEALELFESGVEIPEICEAVGVSEKTIRSYLFDAPRSHGSFPAQSFN